MSVTLIEAGLQELLDRPSGPTGRYVTGLAERVADQARDNVNTQFRSRTGTLYDSIGTFPHDTGNGLAVEVGTDGAPYGLILEQGSDAHEILPINATFLVSTPDNPDPLEAPRRRVLHPGNPPRPWLKPALEQVILGG